MANGNPFYVAPPDIMGEKLRALQTAGYAQQFQSQNAMRNLYRGADINTPAGRQDFTTKAMAIDPEVGLRYMEVFDRMDDRQKQQAMQLKQDAARIAMQINSAPPEAKGTLWQQAGGMYPEVFGGQYQPGAEEQIIQEAQTFDQLLEQRTKRQEETRQPKKTRERIEGGQLIQEEFDPNTQTWARIGGGSRFAPTQPRTPTELETLESWLRSDDPTKRRIAEEKLFKGGQGPFSGESMDAQATNLVYAYETKKAGGGQTTPAEDYAYQLAKNHLENVKIQTTPAGETFTVQPAPLPTMGGPAAQPTGPKIERIDLGAPKQLKETQAKVSRIRQSAQRYEDRLNEIGEGPLLNLTNRGGAALLEQAYNDLMLEAKEAYNLGVLNGPDYQILTTTLTPPTGLGAATLDRAELKAQLQQFRDKINGIETSAQQLYGQPAQTQQQPTIQEWTRDASGRLVPKQ